jgi:hypothetical protein
MYSFQNRFLRTSDLSYNLNSDILNILDKNYRIFSNTDLVPPVYNISYKLKSVNGYDPFILKKYDLFVKQFEKNKKVPINMRVINPNTTNNLFDMLGIKYIFTEKNKVFFGCDNLNLIYKNKKNNLYVYENSDCYPMFYLSQKIKYVEEDEQILKLMQQSDYNYKNIVYTSDNIPKDYIFGNNNLVYQILESDIKEQSAYFKVQVNNTSVFVFNNINYPGWSCKINSVKTQIYNVNYLFTGIILKPGINNIEFSFELY